MENNAEETEVTSDKVRYVSGVLILVGTVVVCVVYSFKRRSKKNDNPRDTVVLHQVGRAPYAPSFSPFALKLETYLRMSQIPYVNSHGTQKSTKGKIPWIEYNGEVVADTYFSIQYLQKVFEKNYTANLSQEEKAIARAFQKLLEENTYWCVTLQRCLYDKEKKLLKLTGVPYFIIWIIGRRYIKQAYSHGIGRHSEKEVASILEADLRAVSDYLGSKKYLMGSEPSEVDCTLFGILAQILWQLPGSYGEQLMTETFTNLQDYCERMKGQFWPDWDDCTTRGGTVKAAR